MFGEGDMDMIFTALTMQILKIDIMFSFRWSIVINLNKGPGSEGFEIRGFFLLLAAKVRSSCEEGPGQSALQSAYHKPQMDKLN